MQDAPHGSNSAGEAEENKHCLASDTTLPISMVRRDIKPAPGATSVVVLSERCIPAKNYIHILHGTSRRTAQCERS
jgi:hypothetical protein